MSVSWSGLRNCNYVQLLGHRKRLAAKQPAGITVRTTENLRTALDLLAECGPLTRSQITAALPERVNGISQTLSDMRAFGFVEHHRKGYPQQYTWAITKRGLDVIDIHQNSNPINGAQ